MKFKIYEYRNDFGTFYKTNLLNDEACLWEHEVEIKEGLDYELGRTKFDVPCVTYDGFTYEVDEIIRTTKTGKPYLVLWTPQNGDRRIKVDILSTKEISTTPTMEETYGY